jgi:hypothetical protein
MREIKVYYLSGLIDFFSFDQFVAKEPLKSPSGAAQNLLTEFRLRLDELEREGLVVETWWHDTTTERANRTTEVIDRGDGKTFSVDFFHAILRPWRKVRLIARSELGDVSKIVVDGEVVVWRQGDDLINGVRFYAAELLYFSNPVTASTNRKALEMFDYIKNAHRDMSDEDIADMLGYSWKAFEQILGQEKSQLERYLPGADTDTTRGDAQGDAAEEPEGADNTDRGSAAVGSEQSLEELFSLFASGDDKEEHEDH